MIEGQDIASVLRYYGADDVPEGYRWRGIRCPFHHDTRASGRVNTELGAFACLGCGVKGDAISLIMQREGVDYPRAIERYTIITGEALPDLPRPTTGKRRRRVSGTGQTAYDTDSGLFSSGVRRRPTAGR